MAVTLIAAQSPSARCAICARPARRGARLCAECLAAVKRARQVPSLPPALLPQGAAIGCATGEIGGGHRIPMPRARATRAGLPAVPGGWATYATLVAFGAAVSLTGYFATQLQDGESSRERTQRAADAAPVADPPGERAAPMRPPAPPHPVAKAIADPEVVAQIEWTVPPAPPARSPRESTARKPLRDARDAGMAPMPTAGTRVDDGARRPAPRVTVATVGAPAPAVAPTPEARVPATPDRWQMLAVALSVCERENVLIGLLCRERARLQYCDGHWGEAPQCPTGALGNNTR